MSHPGLLSIYLDVCCMNRPYDDQSQERIRLESESIRLILERIASGEWSWVGSEAMVDEVGQTPDPGRRARVSTSMQLIGTIIETGDATTDRARSLMALGFRAFDALHLASAELGSADVFLTTDDRLLRTARRVGETLLVRVENPLSWLGEVVAPRNLPPADPSPTNRPQP